MGLQGGKFSIHEAWYQQLAGRYIAYMAPLFTPCLSEQLGFSAQIVLFSLSHFLFQPKSRKDWYLAYNSFTLPSTEKTVLLSHITQRIESLLWIIFWTFIWLSFWLFVSLDYTGALIFLKWIIFVCNLNYITLHSTLLYMCTVQIQNQRHAVSIYAKNLHYLQVGYYSISDALSHSKFVCRHILNTV